jgi:hypothetical protein
MRTGAPHPNQEAYEPKTRYGFTFGIYNQTAPWDDARGLTWVELSHLLTTHVVGSKVGTCIVPAVFDDGKRTKQKARQIDVAFLDSDCGATLQEIRAAIAAQRFRAIVASTHSHLSERTEVARGNWDRFRAATGGDRSATRYLIEDKGFLPRIAAGASVVTETEDQVTFQHQPCPKFRVAIPLLRPWIAASYSSQSKANAAWKERIEALANALQLSHDQSCTDTSRLFYLPRRPAGGPAPETAVLDGGSCDIFALPPAPYAGRKRRSRNSRRSSAGRAAGPFSGFEQPPLSFTDPATGEVLELRAWSRDYGRRLELVTALKARKPEVFIGHVVDGKHHLRCVNAAAHTTGSGDTATFAMNASQSEKGWFIHHCRHAHCDGREHIAFLYQMLEQGWLGVADLTDPAFLRDGPPPKPLIRYVQGSLPAVVDAAEEALLNTGLDVYQRGATIVRPGVVRVAVSDSRSVGTRRLVEVGDRALVELMTLTADWEKFDGRSQDWVRTDAPLNVAATYLQRQGHWRLRVLTGLINAPTLRADGSILAEPGYDAATGLLLETGGAQYPAIPDCPSRDEAASALGLLRALIAEFPFVGPVDQAVAISALLTAAIRRSLPTAPLHGFTAPTAGSGKSKLVDLATQIATGREASVIAQGRTEEELEKRLGAMLLAGDQVIAIDNCETPLGGEFLCQMLTQRMVRARILGRSEAPELPASTMVTATGNNLTLIGDMTRRAVLCRLDPNCERPELRRFAVDPVAQVAADRPRYLIAALTVLRAYHVAGRPKMAEPLGSFSEWSGWVRSALLWLGEADPVASMETIRESDPRLDALISVLTQWEQVLGSKRVSVRDIIDSATEQRTALNSIHSKLEFARPEFREALLSVAGDGGAVNSRRLGRWIAAHENRIVDRMRIQRVGLLGGSMTWILHDQRAEAHHAA